MRWMPDWAAKPAFAAAPALMLSMLIAQAAPPPSPEFEQDEGYRIAVTQYEASTEIDYEEAEATHEVAMTCLVHQPERLDVVCLLEQLTVVEAIDDEGDDIYLPPRRRSGSGSEEYVAFAEGMTSVELKSAELERPAYTIERMQLVTQAVIAHERGEFELRAIVTDDPLDTPYATTVRLSEMKIGRDHVAELVIEYDREDDPGRPLPEAIYALDEDGNVLGGGRWTEGSEIFAPDGKFEAEFFVSDDADVTTLRLVFLTEYEVVPMQFEVEEVFQH
ncbi:MAG: hypothetical protein ACIAXF_12015 [Phycisphaerales bacterium JB063]